MSVGVKGKLKSSGMFDDQSSSSGEFEIVHTVTDYYDGPRGGLANYGGRPHIFESQFRDIDEETDLFLLQPIDEETFRLAVEDWGIWCRWEVAYKRGETQQETHPALPAERARHEELKRILETRLQIEPEKAFEAQGKFQSNGIGIPGVTSSAELFVKWRRLTSAVSLT